MRAARAFVAESTHAVRSVNCVVGCLATACVVSTAATGAGAAARRAGGGVTPANCAWTVAGMAQTATPSTLPTTTPLMR